MKWKRIIETIKSSPNNVFLQEKKFSIFKSARAESTYDCAVLNEIVYHVEKLTVNGYLRVCGANIYEVNKLVKECHPGNKIVIATDVFGGIFAISNGDFEGNEICIWYYAPDTLQWENLNIDYEHFLQWIFTKEFGQFYESFCWAGIEDSVNQIDETQAVLIYPFLWAEECDVNTANKRIVTFSELLKINADNQKNL